MRAAHRLPQIFRWTSLPVLGLLAVLTFPTANAASLESLVMPGPVIEGHADLEEECGSCHAVFDQSSQRRLCLDCHELVAADLTAGTGLHGRHPEVADRECRNCHTEHKGRDADIVGLVPDLFDHSFTDFPLEGAHGSLNCAACHEADVRFADASGECQGCHQDDDPHDGLGDQCGDCHGPDRWREANFDHTTTDFPLIGAHTDARCLSCHSDHRFEAPASECASCHRLDDVHGGTNGSACADCHDSTSWKTTFDHRAETGFALVGAHGALVCSSCHLPGADRSDVGSECADCHRGDDPHLGSRGTACGDCHTETEWTVSFDHAAETGFALSGAHRPLACESCHESSLEAPLDSACVACHFTDDPHEGNLAECDSCHGDQSWADGVRFSHDLASFALVGLHRVATCEQCHASLAFTGTDDECVACHRSEDIHGGAMGEACESCHSPAGWDLWRFDHAGATGFELTGTHADLVCQDCHGPDGTPAERQSSNCIACHRGDDVHRGDFGGRCDRCHTTVSFEELRNDL